ncbi:MAG: hypothetical protein R2827_02590 [Bdellovibrionales bacterium]
MDAKLLFILYIFDICFGNGGFCSSFDSEANFGSSLSGQINFFKRSQAKFELDQTSLISDYWKTLDQSAHRPIIFFIVSSAVWLIIGSIFGLLVSFKFHSPGFLGAQSLLTFGKLRPLHLNIIAYGWLSFAAFKVSMVSPEDDKSSIAEYENSICFRALWNIAVLGCL